MLLGLHKNRAKSRDQRRIRAPKVQEQQKNETIRREGFNFFSYIQQCSGWIDLISSEERVHGLCNRIAGAAMSKSCRTTRSLDLCQPDFVLQPLLFAVWQTLFSLQKAARSNNNKLKLERLLRKILRVKIVETCSELPYFWSLEEGAQMPTEFWEGFLREIPYEKWVSTKHVPCAENPGDRRKLLAGCSRNRCCRIWDERLEFFWMWPNTMKELLKRRDG